MIINHYGHTVNTETPTTGVVSNNGVEWLSDEIDKGIDLDYVEFLATNPTQDEIESWETANAGTVLIGSWIKNDAGEYEPDKTGEYSAIVRETTTQVVWSLTVKKGVALCSPCYPGQADLESAGNCMAYDLPSAIYGSDRSA